MLRKNRGWKDEGTAACPKVAQFGLVYMAFCKWIQDGEGAQGERESEPIAFWSNTQNLTIFSF